MKDYEYFFINEGNYLYNEALKLRYNVFFKNANCKNDVLIDNLEKDAIHLICYEKGKTVIGYGRLNILGNRAHISQLVVDENYRKRGIALHIMNMINEKIISQNVKESFLNAKVDAIKFYEKLGYYDIGGIFPSKKTGIPHIRMVKSIV